MQRQRIGTGSAFESLAGFSRAVVEGNRIHVSGTTGFDYSTMQIDPDPEVQTRQGFRNISEVLRRAGATLDDMVLVPYVLRAAVTLPRAGANLEDVVRVRYLLTDAALFERLAPVFAEHLGRAAPAATAMVVGLIDPRMKIEIEVTAMRADHGSHAA